ncbi:transglycosylase domain-containing protein [Candidatus Microgenomates bacterium]|nr:transglycosylase domain-containing protein [Candidatus Microgenomates bacterium]
MRSRRSSRKPRFTNRLLLVVVGLILVGVIGMFGVFAWFSRDLPAPGKLSQTAQSATVFYDRDGKVLFEMYKDRNRVPVESNEISKYVKDATVAIEDKNFYRHKGFSETGIIRALFSIVTKQGFQGGSTITQQLIKNVLLDARQTPSRKIKEIILATEVERRYTKDQILNMYLNEVPYGGSFWGVGSAARGYFDKAPKDLTILESAFIAGLPQSPSRFSPFIGEKDAWKPRTKDVLRRMREDGYIKREDEDKALKELEKLKFTVPKLAITAPHFVFYVKELIEKEYGVKLLDQGIRVKTTLKRDVQQSAEKIVKEEIEKLKGYDVGNGAAVVLDSKSGEVLAMVGSYDYNNQDYGKFNAAVGMRQPGSTIKPITYATAFEKGYTPSTVIMDLKTQFPDGADKNYEPVNYDGKFRGPVQVRFALGNSYNIPAVKMLAMVGVRDFLKKAEAMGLESFAPTQANINRFGLAITLGGGETTLLDMTGAFSVFAREGKQRELSAITEIKDFKGKTLFTKKDTPERQVISPESTFLISHILSDNNARMDAFGPSSYLNIPGKTVAVKTGTTNDKRDNWTIGFTNDVTVGVWVGNNDNSPMNPKIASGVTGASPIWSRIMRALLAKEYKDGIMAKPDKVKAVVIDGFLGGLPKDGYPTRSEYFIDGTEPKDISPFYKKLKISKSTGKLANDVEIRTNNYDEKDFVVITENDPVSGDGKNRWQEAINAWSKEQGDKGDEKFKFPTENSDARQDDVAVSIKTPSDHARVDDNNVNVKATITSIAPIKSTKIFFNNEEKWNRDGNRSDLDETFNVPDGVYEIKVVVKNEKDKEGSSTIKIGVKKNWDEGQPTPNPQ